MTYCVKVKKLTDRRWKFFAGGGLNSLRIHASEFPDKQEAERTAAEINRVHSTEYEAKVVKFSD